LIRLQSGLNYHFLQIDIKKQKENISSTAILKSNPTGNSQKRLSGLSIGKTHLHLQKTTFVKMVLDFSLLFVNDATTTKAQRLKRI
jgi:hypothetical protein